MNYHIFNGLGNFSKGIFTFQLNVGVDVDCPIPVKLMFQYTLYKEGN